MTVPSAAPSAAPSPAPLPLATLHVGPWADPVIDELGFDLRSAYVERFWLATLGPSTTFLLRLVADRFDLEPEGFELDLADTAGRLGLAARGGRHSPFMRALDRTAKFGLARRHADTYEVRRRVPPLTLAQVARLPARLQEEHAAWQAADLRAPERDLQRRARRVALGLLEAGERLDLVERQLHVLEFHPAVAHDAVRWALEHRGGGVTLPEARPRPAA